MTDDIKALIEQLLTAPYMTSVIRRKAAGTITALQAENASLRLDAERYRWLRAHWGYLLETYDGDTDRMVSIDLIQEGFIEEGWPVDSVSLDEALDAALAQTDKEKP